MLCLSSSAAAPAAIPGMLWPACASMSCPASLPGLPLVAVTFLTVGSLPTIVLLLADCVFVGGGVSTSSRMLSCTQQQDLAWQGEMPTSNPVAVLTCATTAPARARITSSRNMLITDLLLWFTCEFKGRDVQATTSKCFEALSLKNATVGT